MAGRRREAIGDSAADDRTRRKTYGRRHGRKLRPQRRALLEGLLPRLAIELPPPPARLDWQRLFSGKAADLWLEIGFGGGEHLVWQAGQNPSAGLIGADYFVNGIASLCQLAAQQGLENVRVFQGDGRELLAALPDRALGRVFVLFPDPWRKARHHKRRLVGRETLDELARVMKDGAELRLATDHRDYLVWMLEACCAHPAFRWCARRPADWRRRPADWPATRYEQKAIDAGRRPTYLRFQRKARRPG